MKRTHYSATVPGQDFYCQTPMVSQNTLPIVLRKTNSVIAVLYFFYNGAGDHCKDLKF